MASKDIKLYTFCARHRIGDAVYHVTGESQKGFVIDVRYSVRDSQVEYLVVFNHTQPPLSYYEDELSSSPIF